jgi:ATP-dependent RNA circularization protein (DNA/RNA ligase family)
MKRGHRYYLASRNVELGIKGSTNYHKVWNKYKLKDVLDAEMRLRNGHSIAIQGESCGPGIQGNKYGFTDNQFFVFDVKDVTENRYYDFVELAVFCNTYNLPMVSFVDKRPMPSTPEELQAIANAQTYVLEGKTLPHEGVVVRPYDAVMEAKAGMSNHASFKVINEEFASKYLD